MYKRFNLMMLGAVCLVLAGVGFSVFSLSSGDKQIPIARMGSVSLVIDPDEHNPLEGKASCLDAVYRCTEDALADQTDFYTARHMCVLKVDICSATTSITNCCPKECIEQYRKLIDTNIDTRPAYDRSLLFATSCFPGLEDWLAGKER